MSVVDKIAEEYTVILMRNRSDFNERAARWFHEKWKVSEELYVTSIQECQKKQRKIPQWYLVLIEDKIIGGLGVIENDFHKRTDLTPNICALYIEEEYRKLGIAKKLLDFVCKDLSTMGYQDVYLITEHMDFYEKCGWEFHCMVEEEDGHITRMYHIALI